MTISEYQRLSQLETNDLTISWLQEHLKIDCTTPLNSSCKSLY